MIVDRIYEYLGGEMAKADGVFLDAAAKAFRRSLMRNLTDEPREERLHLSASSSWYCGRKIVYGLRQTDRAPINPRARLAFLMGDVLEQTGVLLSRLAGVPVLTPSPDGIQEACVLDIGGQRVHGHIDMTVADASGAAVPVDWKSMADYGFDEFVKATTDPSAKWWTEQRWDYLTQLRIYMKAKSARYGLFCAINKNTGHMAEMHVPEDPAWWDEMQARARFIGTFLDAESSTPDRPAWARTVRKEGRNLRSDKSEGPVDEIESWRCGYCPFVSTCWEGFSLVPLKGKPAWRKAVEPVTTDNGGK